MLLAPPEAELFFKLHRSLMCFVNERLQVVPGIDTPDQFSALSPETRLAVRKAFLDETDLIELFLDANPFDFKAEELAFVASWRHQVAGEFYIFRYLKNHAIFLAADKPPIAYGVVALSDPFENMVGPYLPIWTETVLLLPFGDKIVYDGLLNSYRISFGPGIRRSLNASYKAAKKRRGIVTTLPVEARPIAATKRPQKPKPASARASSDAIRDVLEVVLGMVDQFCHDHLNGEYAVLCRQLAEKLARKRPSPLLSGSPHTWASGIVRTVGWVNFLHDKSQSPHMRLGDIDAVFGISESSGAAKLAAIRKMLRIHRFDPNWILPSRLDDNPVAWMLQVNGFPMDVRHAPREVQEIAFEKGLIPYIPADRD
jgi:hypothetical protein